MVRTGPENCQAIKQDGQVDGEVDGHIYRWHSTITINVGLYDIVLKHIGGESHFSLCGTSAIDAYDAIGRTQLNNDVD